MLGDSLGAGIEPHAVYFRTQPAAGWELVAAWRKERYLTRAEEYMIALATQYYQAQRA